MRQHERTGPPTGQHRRAIRAGIARITLLLVAGAAACSRPGPQPVDPVDPCKNWRQPPADWNTEMLPSDRLSWLLARSYQRTPQGWTAPGHGHIAVQILDHEPASVIPQGPASTCQDALDGRALGIVTWVQHGDYEGYSFQMRAIWQTPSGAWLVVNAVAEDRAAQQEQVTSVMSIRAKR